MARDLTTSQKKELAKTLYLDSNSRLTIQELAAKVGVSRNTMSKWINAENWDELKAGITIMPSEQIKMWNRQIMEINNKIAGRPEGQRFANNAEADTLVKLSTAIKKIKTESNISDVIAVSIEVTQFIGKFDFDFAKKVAEYFDKFIAQKMDKKV